jgi:serine/threonine protein kinase, bacterial
MLRERYPNGMPPDEVVRIIGAVAEALDYAHQQQLLHRDVKPSNILLSHPEEPGERILLADFGIARWIDDASGLTATNMAVGTVAYAAPEQLMGEQVNGRADQYALAATAFHLLTGTPLFSLRSSTVLGNARWLSGRELGHTRCRW